MHTRLNLVLLKEKPVNLNIVNLIIVNLNIVNLKKDMDMMKDTMDMKNIMTTMDTPVTTQTTFHAVRRFMINSLLISPLTDQLM